MAQEGRSSCEACQSAWAPSKWDTPAERKHKSGGPPCDKCKPVLHPSLRQAVRVYLECATQFVMGPNGPLDLSIPAIRDYMDIEGITDQRRCLRRVLTLGRINIAVMNERAQKAREGKHGA